MSKMIEILATLALCVCWFAVVQVAEARMKPAAPAASTTRAGSTPPHGSVQVARAAHDSTRRDGASQATAPAAAQGRE